MHPAFSVIAFTTLSGAGYGLLAWIGLILALGQPLPLALLLWFVAMLAISAGLLASTAHLGHPERAWRAFSQWRSSWLSREGVAALLTYLPALALGLALAGLLPAQVLRPTALLSVLGAVATVYCTARIYDSLSTIPAWRHRLVRPVYGLLAIYSGGWWLWAVLAPAAQASPMIFAPTLAVLAMLAMLAKLRYWRDLRTMDLPGSRASALGLPAGTRVRRFEGPHTEANYLTREMGFRVARRHARQLSLICLLMGFVLPTVLGFVTLLSPRSAWLLIPFAALPMTLGIALERWLFFAQARHVIDHYYQETS